MVKKKKVINGKEIINERKLSFFPLLLYFLLGSIIALFILVIISILKYEHKYNNRIYPGVTIDGWEVGGKNPEEVKAYFENKSEPLKKINFTLYFEDNIATISGTDLGLSFDGKLSAIQAYLIGRSGHLFSDVYQKLTALKKGLNLNSVLNIKTENIDDALISLSGNINITPQDALFQFENGKVLIFKPSTNGRRLNKEATKNKILSYIYELKKTTPVTVKGILIPLEVDIVYPKYSTDNSNNYGIRELLASGNSKFAGSIPGRIHNIELAASRIHGHLVPPGGIFSFNDALGDVSASTGFQPAYIIKDGRTVLGDGGGVCQVSTTLFRAILNSGLKVVERHPHSYRVSYYEQNSGPGLDATVYYPGYDLKFENDTANYLLIQSRFDKTDYSLIFEIFGTKDGRKVEITKPVILSQISAPPDLYQDDPTLPKGVVKQVDWRAAGAKVSLSYKVTKDDKTLSENTFYSNFQPWQAVFLRGTKE